MDFDSRNIASLFEMIHFKFYRHERATRHRDSSQQEAADSIGYPSGQDDLED